MLKATAKQKATQTELEAEYENWPVPAFLSFMRRLSNIAAGLETHPQWDKFPHRAKVVEKTTVKSGVKKIKRVVCFPVQAPLDHLAAYHKLRTAPSRVAFKSLVLFSSGDVVVTFGPLIFEHVAEYSNLDDSIPATHGKIKFCSIAVPYSSSPLPVLESEYSLIGQEDAKRDKYMNLPPFNNFAKYARNKIGTLILNANSEFMRRGYKVQFKKETLLAARTWMLETPEYIDHGFWNHRKLTPAICGEVLTDFAQDELNRAAQWKAEKKRAREEAEQQRREQARLNKIYRKGIGKHWS